MDHEIESEIGLEVFVDDTMAEQSPTPMKKRKSYACPKGCVPLRFPNSNHNNNKTLSHNSCVGREGKGPGRSRSGEEKDTV